MFTDVLKQTCNKVFKTKFFFGSAGSVLVPFTICKTFFELDTWTSTLYGLYLFGGWFLIVFLYYAFKWVLWEIHVKYVESLWGKTVVSIRDITSLTFDTINKKEPTAKDYTECLQSICDKVKVVLDETTSTDCSVSIKIPVSNTNTIETIEVRNLCRDKKHSARDTQSYKEVQHTIIKNSAYIHIVNKLVSGKTKVYYINHNIGETKDYLNSTTESYKNGEQLPYNSEIVLCISPIPSNSNNNAPQLRGFLCVDSDKADAFSKYESYHISYLQTISSFLNLIIEKL